MFAGDNRVDTAARSFLRDHRGVAAIEFAFIAGFLCLAVVNVSDIGIYLYKRMQVENAAQMGIMSALSTCAVTRIPATVGSNCSGLSAAVTAAIQTHVARDGRDRYDLRGLLLHEFIERPGPGGSRDEHKAHQLLMRSAWPR